MAVRWCLPLFVLGLLFCCTADAESTHCPTDCECTTIAGRIRLQCDWSRLSAAAVRSVPADTAQLTIICRDSANDSNDSESDSEFVARQFRSLPNLTSLTIESCRLSPNATELPTDLFDGLISLKHLRLARLHGATIDDSALFYSISHVQSLAFDGVQFASASVLHQIIHNTPQLRRCDFANAPLDSIDEPFAFATYLEHLQLTNASIRFISEDALSTLDSLQRLNLSHNQLQSMQFLAQLPNVQKLVEIDVSWNELTALPAASLVSFNSVRALHLQHNRLLSLDLSDLPANLYILHLDHNQLHALFNSRNSTLDKLMTLTASHNELNVLTPAVAQPGLRTVSLSHNAIQYIINGSFARSTRLSQIDLAYNNLTEFDPVVLLGAKARNERVYVQLRGNGIDCAESSTHVIVSDRTSFDCNSHTRSVYGKPVNCSTFDSAVRVCAPGCSCCGILDCICENVCPVGCVCSLNAARTQIECLRCVFTNETSGAELPNEFPRKMTRLTIENSSAPALSHLAEDFLSHYPDLQQLRLRHCRIASVAAGAFRNLPVLKTLDLSHNRLTKFTGSELRDASLVLTVDLSHNRLRSTPPLLEDTQALRHVSTLRLHGNRMRQLPTALLVEPGLSLLHSLSLADNPYECDERVWRWMQQADPDVIAKISDARAVRCRLNGYRHLYVPYSSDVPSPFAGGSRWWLVLLILAALALLAGLLLAWLRAKHLERQRRLDGPHKYYYNEQQQQNGHAPAQADQHYELMQWRHHL